MIQYFKTHLNKVNSKKSLKEKIIIECKNCKKLTEHVYEGDFGTQWKPQHLYICQVCHGKYISLDKLKGGK